MVEHFTCNEAVLGSSPRGGSMIYFCHIPKTSGTSVDTSLIVNKDKIKFRLSGDSNELESEATLTKYLSKCKDNDIIKGHYAATPFKVFPGIKGYSILRDPMDRLLSAFRYSQQPSTWTKPFKNVLYSFLTNKEPGNSIVFDGRPNMQSLFLTQPLEWSNGSRDSVLVRHSEMNLSDVLSIIKNNNTTLSTIENRDYILYEMSSELTKATGRDVVLNSFIKMNENPFKMDVTDILSNFYDQIYNLNKLDFDLYTYVSNHERMNGRALSPSDIIL